MLFKVYSLTKCEGFANSLLLLDLLNIIIFVCIDKEIYLFQSSEVSQLFFENLVGISVFFNQHNARKQDN